MNGRGPASLLVDSSGNLVGVVQDGTVYRLQVEGTITDGDGNTANVELDGTRKALAVSDPELLAVASGILNRLDRILAHLEVITGQEDPL